MLISTLCDLGEVVPVHYLAVLHVGHNIVPPPLPGPVPWPGLVQFTNTHTHTHTHTRAHIHVHKHTQTHAQTHTRTHTHTHTHTHTCTIDCYLASIGYSWKSENTLMHTVYTTRSMMTIASSKQQNQGFEQSLSMFKCTHTDKNNVWISTRLRSCRA